MKQWFKVVGGFLLVLLGLVGLALPLVPGLVLLTAGAVLLAPSYPVVQRLLIRFKRWQSNNGSGLESKE